MTHLNSRLSIPAMILTALGMWLAPERCEAQNKLIQGTVYKAPYYQVQVYYEVRGAYQYYPHYTWITVLETDDYEEAEFVYALYSLAAQQGILDEVAPNFDSDDGYLWKDYTALDVQMLTKYRSLGYGSLLTPTTGVLQRY